MKKLLLMLSICFIALAGFTQTQRTVVKDTSDKTSGKFQKKADRKKQLASLNLSKEQKGKMKEIKRSNKAEKETIENDETLSERQKKEKLKLIKKEQAKNVQGILNSEQKKQMMQMRKEKKGKSKN